MTGFVPPRVAASVWCSKCGTQHDDNEPCPLCRAVIENKISVLQSEYDWLDLNIRAGRRGITIMRQRLMVVKHEILELELKL